MKLLFILMMLPLLLVAQTEYTGKATRILDGDTFDFSYVSLTGEQTATIRLNGIDAPEKNQPYGDESTTFLSNTIYMKQIKIIAFGGDRYNRILADVFCDNVNVNQLLIGKGCAWWYAEYSTDTTLASLEKLAKLNRLGLWRETSPVAPWFFRKHTPTEYNTAVVPPTKNQNDNVGGGRCQATTKKGSQCKRNAAAGSQYCWQHNK